MIALYLKELSLHATLISRLSRLEFQKNYYFF